MVQKISPNADLIELNKYDSILRRNGFTPMQIMAIKRMVVEERDDIRWQYCEYIPFVICSILGNVLHGNNYASNKRIQEIIFETCQLYNEVDIGLLDIEEITKYNKDNFDLTLVINKPELVHKLTKPEISIADVKSYPQRTRDLMKKYKDELDKRIADDPDDEEAHSQYRMLNDMQRKFKRAGLI